MNNTKRVAKWLVSEEATRNNGLLNAVTTEAQMMKMIEKTSMPLSLIAGIKKADLLDAINNG
jgi:hypothetical protein